MLSKRKNEFYKKSLRKPKQNFEKVNQQILLSECEQNSIFEKERQFTLKKNDWKMKLAYN